MKLKLHEVTLTCNKIFQGRFYGGGVETRKVFVSVYFGMKCLNCENMKVGIKCTALYHTSVTHDFSSVH